MKRFEFSLNKLMDYKQQILDREKNDLAHLRIQQQQMMDEKDQLEKTLKRSADEFRELSGKGITVMQITMFKGYHQSLRMQIKELEESIEKMEVKVQKQLGVVVEATKEVSSLEKLEEKQLEDYNFKVAKAEEQFISEYVMNSTYR
ncbi:MAG: flagellar export protein FliJ [Oscillospiraceae bacterium]|nr:flagellar export protein FliJ [Oscillospiraceae bacterium]